jgi:hypothetical protein
LIYPTPKIEYLGFLIDSTKINVTLPEEKCDRFFRW